MLSNFKYNTLLFIAYMTAMFAYHLKAGEFLITIFIALASWLEFIIIIIIIYYLNKYGIVKI